MKIPKYIQQALDRRAKLAVQLNKADTTISFYYKK